MAAAVLQDEVAVEQDGLNLRQEGVILIDVSPPGLYHADFRIREVRQEPVEEVRSRQKIRVEDGDVAAPGHVETGFQRTGLKACAVCAMEVLDVDAVRRMAADCQFGDLAGLVG